MPHVVSANRLTDGLVVFWAAGGRWREKLGEAELLPDAAAAKAALALAQTGGAGAAVVDAYTFEVREQAGGIVAAHLRDRIRAEGPTIVFDAGAHGREG